MRKNRKARQHDLKAKRAESTGGKGEVRHCLLLKGERLGPKSRRLTQAPYKAGEAIRSSQQAAFGECRSYRKLWSILASSSSCFSSCARLTG